MTSDTNTSGSDLADTSSETTKSTDELSDSVDDASTDVAEDVADAEEDGLSEDSSVSSSEEFHEDIGEDSSEGAIDDGLEVVPEDVTDDESATDAPESPGEVASEDVPDDAASDVPEVGPGNGSDMSAREVDAGVETESESTEETEQNELGAKESAEETNAERDGAHGGVSDAWAEESADSQVDDADSAEGESARESVEDGGVIGNASEAASEDVPLGVSQEPIAEQVDAPTVEAHQPQDALDGREIDPCDDVWNHCDNPENTDYLADSDRARETLSPFRSENWEDMPADDRKGYIEGLADYHADILAVGGKPFIEYYNGSSNDFGAFDPNTNTLMINERNLDDGPEVADTVSHEYRHAYQHQCSENPINERDEIFRDNIVNPIDASVDYQEYRDQPIERDARAYAQRFKNYAQS